MFTCFEKQQKDVCKLLNNAKNTGRYSHAYLFVINKYDRAYDFINLFIKTICCPNISNKHCENCNICKLIDSNSFSDLKIIDSESLVLKKDSIIELQDYFETKKLYANKRVYLIKLCEKMNSSASNTLLKFLEEPEDDIIAILTTNNINQVLDTIKSRCQIVNFNTYVDESTDNLYSQLCISNVERSVDEFNLDIKRVIDFSIACEKYGVNALCFTKKIWHTYFNDRSTVKYALNIMLYLYLDTINYKIGQPIRYFKNYISDLEFISNRHELEYYNNKVSKIVKYIDLMKYNLNLNIFIDKMLIEWEVYNNE